MSFKLPNAHLLDRDTLDLAEALVVDNYLEGEYSYVPRDSEGNLTDEYAEQLRREMEQNDAE